MCCRRYLIASLIVLATPPGGECVDNKDPLLGCKVSAGRSLLQQDRDAFIGTNLEASSTEATPDSTVEPSAVFVHPIIKETTTGQFSSDGNVLEPTASNEDKALDRKNTHSLLSVDTIQQVRRIPGEVQHEHTTRDDVRFQMTEFGLPKRKICNGSGKWYGKMSASRCRDRCLESDACSFVIYKGGKCVSFSNCDVLKTANGKTIGWMKAGRNIEIEGGYAICTMNKVPLQGCSGAPWSGWGQLGKNVSQTECKQACVELPHCAYAVWKSGSCSAFTSCAEKNVLGVSVWKKVKDTDDLTNDRRITPEGQKIICLRQDLTRIEFSGRDHKTHHPRTGTDRTSWHEALTRPEYTKTLRCLAGECTECRDSDGVNCWAGKYVLKHRLNEVMSLEVRGQTSTWNEFVDRIHVNCPTDYIILEYQVNHLVNGELHFQWNGEAIEQSNPLFNITSDLTKRGEPIASGFTSEDFAQISPYVGLRVKVHIDLRLGIKTHAHTLDVIFRCNPKARGSNSRPMVCSDGSALLNHLWINMDDAFAKCEDHKACLKSLSKTSDGMELRQLNSLQYQCLHASDPSQISSACQDWRDCLENQTVSNTTLDLITLLAAAGVNSSSSSVPMNTTSCIDPRLEDPETWECDCYEKMHKTCNAIKLLESIRAEYSIEKCMRAIFCDEDKTCSSWRDSVSCDNDPDIKALQEAIRDVKSQESMLQRSQRSGISAASAGTVSETYKTAEDTLSNKHCN